ncbi:MAG: hypothetical protein JNJ44_08375, partial [Zoogloeaceae bacterium]|nr:hypothetical protein [Zoogloeaceae bacterium]
ALVWALENPRAGVVEAEDLDHHRVMTIARPYLGDLIGIDTPWRPPGAGPLVFSRFLAEQISARADGGSRPARAG